MNSSAAPVPFVPTDFAVPQSLETDEFRLRMLTVNDVVKDYDAVMSSADHCKTIWPGLGWPEGLTLEQNLIDLGWHQKEFQMRRSFAYTVVNPSESKVLGCVYIYPDASGQHDARVRSWVRASRPELDVQLWRAVTDWLAEEWPFERVAYAERADGS